MPLAARGVGKRWTVGPDDGATVREVLAKAGADRGAVEEGRVFVGPRRVRRDSERVRVGDELSIAPPALPRPEEVVILTRTRDLVVADKPAGVPTIADPAGSAHALWQLVA